MFLEKKEAGEVVVSEPNVEYGKGEGRLEWLERMVVELDARVRALEEEVKRLGVGSEDET